MGWRTKGRVHGCVRGEKFSVQPEGCLRVLMLETEGGVGMMLQTSVGF